MKIKELLCIAFLATFGLGFIGCGGGGKEAQKPDEFGAPPTEEPEIRSMPINKIPNKKN